MKISVDDKELFTLSENQKKVIMNDIHPDQFDADMKRRLEYILMDKYERCFERFKKEWEPKLAQVGVQAIPVDRDAFCNLVFAQPSYQGRRERELA